MRPIRVVAAAVVLTSGSLLAPVPVTAQGSPAFAPRAIWVDLCDRELEARIRQDHPHTAEVVVAGGTVSEWAWSRTEVAVAGEGRMRRGSSWDDFDFVCLIDARSNAVTALDWSGPLRDGEPVRRGARPPSRLLGGLEDTSPAGRGCRAALEAAIRADHPRSGKIELDRRSLRRWQRSAIETGVRGEGTFAGSRGLAHPFEFTCVWDERRGRAGALFYELR